MLYIRSIIIGLKQPPLTFILVNVYKHTPNWRTKRRYVSELLGAQIARKFFRTI